MDDPQLTPRGVYRERPLTRVIFDRRLRTPAHAAVLSTATVGPVIIMTTAAERRATPAQSAPLEERRREDRVPRRDGRLRASLERLADRGVESLLLEGGAAVHGAAWDEDVVDVVRLYVSPATLGPGGVPFLGGRELSTAALIERRVEAARPRYTDRRICSRASLNPLENWSSASRSRPGSACGSRRRSPPNSRRATASR